MIRVKENGQVKVLYKDGRVTKVVNVPHCIRHNADCFTDNIVKDDISIVHCELVRKRFFRLQDGLLVEDNKLSTMCKIIPPGAEVKIDGSKFTFGEWYESKPVYD